MQSLENGKQFRVGEPKKEKNIVQTEVEKICTRVDRTRLVEHSGQCPDNLDLLILDPLDTLGEHSNLHSLDGID